MPQLQEHMLRVAGVAEIITDNIDLSRPSATLPMPGEGNIDKQAIIIACLLHDMGNIVKFDFSRFPEMVEEKGVEYWEKIKQETLKKYGANSHEATRNMLKELGVSERILELVDAVGFDQGEANMQSADFGKKICAYADMRVLPKGAGSLEDRMADLRVRYKDHPEGAENREVFEQALREIEKQIFEKCKIRPEEITDENIRQKLEKL
ncbi:MAG: HD domain-containing protein [Patescibacteria group bacterium]